MAAKNLSRSLGLFQVTITGIGIILGAGIYALIGVAATTAGNAVWLSFLLSALVALFTGLSYAELASMFRGDAGEYDYVTAGISKHFAFFIALSIIIAGVVSAATVALGFAGYFTTLVHLPLTAAAITLIFLMTIINLVGIKETTWFNTVSTFIEFAGLILIIAIGYRYVGDVDLLEMPKGFSGVVSSAALVFFAYMGFESIVKLRDETKDPEKTIPKALIYSTVITSIVYVLVAICAVSVLGWQKLSSTAAPMAMVAAEVLGSKALLALVVVAMFSTANTVLITMVAVSRQMYGMAKESSLPKILARVGSAKTPWVAILAATAMALAFVLVGKIGLVANLTDVFLFLTFACVNLSLIVLRYRAPAMRRPFRCPVNVGKFSVIALLGFLSALGMMVVAIANLVVGTH
ncbi:amino acid permease [Candidatus Woesearchaeota archaeon]|nr:amino acid permease [Candidatus Woesearchaeota archaeon]